MHGAVERPVQAGVLGGLDERVRQPRHMSIAIGCCKADEGAPLGVRQGRPLTDLRVVDEVGQGSPTDTGTGRPDRTVSSQRNRVNRIPEGEVSEVDPDGPAVHLLGELRRGLDLRGANRGVTYWADGTTGGSSPRQGATSTRWTREPASRLRASAATAASICAAKAWGATRRSNRSC